MIMALFSNNYHLIYKLAFLSLGIHVEEAGVRGNLGRYLGTFEVRMNIFVPFFYEPEN
jgi:hypothetical protein